MTDHMPEPAPEPDNDPTQFCPGTPEEILAQTKESMTHAYEGCDDEQHQHQTIDHDRINRGDVMVGQMLEVVLSIPEDYSKSDRRIVMAGLVAEALSALSAMEIDNMISENSMLAMLAEVSDGQIITKIREDIAPGIVAVFVIAALERMAAKLQPA